MDSNLSLAMEQLNILNLLILRVNIQEMNSNLISKLSGYMAANKSDNLIEKRS